MKKKSVSMNQKKEYRFFVGCIFLCCILFAAAMAAADTTVNDLTIITEQYPPYNFEENGQVKGISTDTMALMLKKAGAELTNKDIKIYPWARGYNDVLNDPDTCLFSTTRTSERESLFKWVGPVGVNKLVLTGRKDRGIKILKVQDLKDYKIGVILEDVVDQILSGYEFLAEKIERVSKTEMNVFKLNSGRIDLLGYGEDVARWEIKKLGFDPDDYETVWVLQTKDLYFAFNRQTPDHIVVKLQKALDLIKASGEYQRIVNSYLK